MRITGFLNCLTVLSAFGPLASAQDISEDPGVRESIESPVAAPTAAKKRALLACGGLRFSAYYLQEGGTVCFDRKLNRYLVTFSGVGLSSTQLSIQGFFLSIVDDGSIAGIYRGGFAGTTGGITARLKWTAGKKAFDHSYGGSLGMNVGFYVKADSLVTQALTGQAILFGLGKGISLDPGLDFSAQAMIITAIR